jgi:outer membrane immunogenic protein
MKRILLSTISLGVLGLVSPALGADLPPYSKAPALAAPVSDWSGFYIGGFGGGGWGNHNVSNSTGNATPFADYTANYPSQGFLGGGEAGYNLQSGNVVVGIEATGFWSNISGSDANAVSQGLLNIANIPAIDEDKVQWGGTLRARGGVTVDRLMLFFTGGWAFGDIQHTNTAVPPVPGFPVVDQFTVHANGVVAGGGLAYALTNNLIGKIEYSWYNFNAYNRPAVGPAGLTANGQLPYTTNTEYSIVTVGLDYKFGGPVVAKY